MIERNVHHQYKLDIHHIALLKFRITAQRNTITASGSYGSFHSAAKNSINDVIAYAIDSIHAIYVCFPHFSGNFFVILTTFMLKPFELDLSDSTFDS